MCSIGRGIAVAADTAAAVVVGITVPAGVAVSVPGTQAAQSASNAVASVVRTSSGDKHL